MFKVKATVINMLGDVKKYPCHFNYKIGDEIIYTGAEFKGRICSAILPMLSHKIGDLYAAGPRHVEPMYYLPFWYAPPSASAPSMKKYDGNGFKNVLKTVKDVKYGMSLLRDPRSFLWPPFPERAVAKDILLTCPDSRTSVVFKFEAFDLTDDGDSLPYFRRMMAILSKVLPKPGIPVDKILNEFSKEEILEIYPALSQILMSTLVEELELMNYLEVKNGKASVTKKGEVKLQDFKASLSAAERKALKI